MERFYFFCFKKFYSCESECLWAVALPLKEKMRLGIF